MARAGHEVESRLRRARLRWRAFPVIALAGAGLSVEDKLDILLVEDSRPLREYWALLLREDGFRVTEAGDFATAGGLMRIRNFDLVITDYRIPGGTGAGVAEELHNLQSGTPLVVVTGSDVFEHGEVFREIPNVFFLLRKPVLERDLLAVVDYARTRARARPPAAAPDPAAWSWSA